MSKTDHLAKAKSYIAKGEDYYRKAAEEIVAAMEADPTLGYGKIGERLGRDKSWVRRLVTWSTNGEAPTTTPFARVEGETERKNRTAARQVAREEPEALADAIAQAPPKAQREFADALVKHQSVEPSAARVVNPPASRSRQPKSVEQKVGDAVFALWEASELLMDEVPAGDAKVRMIALAEKAQRLSDGIVQLLGTGEFEDAFRDLVEEVGAEA